MGLCRTAGVTIAGMLLGRAAPGTAAAQGAPAALQDKTVTLSWTE
jgi:hypothetical protein